MVVTKNEKFLRFDGESLWIKVGGMERNLGAINTRFGGLTREEKLKAVAGKGQWVKV